MRNLLSLLFSFDGCIGRGVWWTSNMGLWLVLYVVATLLDFLGVPVEIVRGAILLLFPWPWYALQFKRWHDRGKSGYWCLLPVIPIFGVIWAFIELGFLPRSEKPVTHSYRGLDPWEF